MNTLNLIEAVLGAASTEVVDQLEALKRGAQRRVEEAEYAGVGVDNHAGKFVTEVAQKADAINEFPDLAAKTVQFSSNPTNTDLDIETIRAQVDSSWEMAA